MEQKATQEQKATLRYLKIAPRKVRLVADSLKGLSVNEAEAQLLMSPKRSCPPLLRLLRSSVANAKNNAHLNPEQLFVKNISVDSGPMVKRYMPRAMGRANLIQKKSSHVTMVLATAEKPKEPRFKIVKPERISKREKAEKIKKAKKETEAKKPRMAEEKEKPKPSGKPGFIKRIFRRKSI